MKIEIIPIKDIKPYPKNSKTHPPEQIEKIARSIEEFGMNVPLILDKENNIIAGHGRLLALESLGKTETPIIRIEHLTPQQITAYRIADNKTAESEWEYDFLKQEIIDLKDAGYDVELTGFTERELRSILHDETGDIKEIDAADPNKIETNITRGDIYILGNHRLMCGDSTNSTDIESLLNNKIANILITDPPYGVDYGSKNDFLNKYDKGNTNQKAIENDDLKDMESWNDKWIANIINKIDNTFHIFGASTKLHLLVNALEKHKAKISAHLIWVKNNHVLGRVDYSFKHEPIVYGWFNKHKFYGGFQTTVLNYDKPLHNDLHPTMKPIGLIAELITHVTEKNGIVLDIFGGSGSTLIAAEQTNRICYMMEYDPKYCEVICQRWETLTGKKREKQ